MKELLDPNRILTLRQAAALCLVSTDTLKRRIGDGRLPNAHRDPFNGHGQWLVSIADLVADRLLDPTEVQPVTVPAQDADASGEPVTDWHAEVVVLRAELAVRAEQIAFLRSLVSSRLAS
ncbi:MAG: hypothetical protein WCP28_16645 [Actinomycetes bacterium]